MTGTLWFLTALHVVFRFSWFTEQRMSDFGEAKCDEYSSLLNAAFNIRKHLSLNKIPTATVNAVMSAWMLVATHQQQIMNSSREARSFCREVFISRTIS
jgi:hypothetical protein